MKAWRLAMADGSFTCSDVPVPAAREGSVLVRMQASPLLSYLRSFVAGELTSYSPPPLCPTARSSCLEFVSAPTALACPPSPSTTSPRTS